jgi:hypothetical protein
MCDLYSLTKTQDAMRALLRVKDDRASNLPPMPSIFPDYPAPIVRMADCERELAMASGACLGWIAGGIKGKAPG